jgi:hypothetical protein
VLGSVICGPRSHPMTHEIDNPQDGDDPRAPRTVLTFPATYVLAALMLTLLPVALAGQEASGRADASHAAAQAVVECYIAAYNRHDVDAMVELVHPEVEWLSVTGATISVEAHGAAALHAALRRYFASLPSARAAIEAMMPAGAYVSVYERAHWEVRGEGRSQTALAVYEVADGRIRRVWYYPVQR